MRCSTTHLTLITERMNAPFTASEDKVVREIKYREAKKRMLPMLPRIAAIGFIICIFTVVAVKSYIGLDTKTALICILLPTPLMLAHLWITPLRIRYEGSKWTMKENKIQMRDGFYIPAKGFQMWSFSVEDFKESEGYRVVTLKAQSGLSKTIVLNDSNLIDALIDYLKNKGVIQS